MNHESQNKIHPSKQDGNTARLPISIPTEIHVGQTGDSGAYLRSLNQSNHAGLPLLTGLIKLNEEAPGNGQFRAPVL